MRQDTTVTEQFDWVPDVSRGEWLRPLESEPFGSILSIVPRGFEAYARVFHPVERDRPRATLSWTGLDEETFFESVPDIDAALETERTTWAQTAHAFGTTMHSEAQYHRLTRSDYGDAGGVAPDGWRYGDASEGSLDGEVLSVVADVLARHTETPDAGVAAIWEGWGGLVRSAGVASFVAWEASGNPVRDALLKARLAAGEWTRGIAPFVPGLAPEEPPFGSGLLARDVAAGPRFDLHADTGRRYVLFEAGARDLMDAGWTQRAPWIDDGLWAQSPSILWPDDHAWLLATEIDYDSTLVAGSTSLIRELVQTPNIEALPIRPDADLSSDGDALNRP